MAAIDPRRLEVTAATPEPAPDKEETGRASGTVQAVDRAIAILQAFTHEAPELTLAAIASRTRLHKPTAFRLLATLKQRGLISQRQDSGAYRLGSEIAALAAVRMHQSGLLDFAMPVMRKVRDTIGETVSLATRVGDFRVQLYQIEGLHSLRRGTRAGERTPLYAGASNKLLLASMDDPDVADYLSRTKLEPFTAITITDPERIWAEIYKIRQVGYAESLGEKYLGGTSLAAPIRDAYGAVVAAIFVSIAEQRYTPEMRLKCLDALLKGAAEISYEYGARP